MFYNHEYFTKRKGGFGTIWLAATLGPSSAFKKLSKKEIMDCNIPKTVNKLIEPEEPLALRLSSNLMFGVTRIYSYQCNYLHQNATSTHTSLKHAIIQLAVPSGKQGGGKSGLLTLGNEANNSKSITIAGVGGFGPSVRNADTIRLGGIEGGGDFFDEFQRAYFGQEDDVWRTLHEGIEEVAARGQGGAKRKLRAMSATPGLEAAEWENEVITFEADEDEYVEGGKKKKRAKKEPGPKRSTTVGRPEDINLPAHLREDLGRYDDEVPLGDMLDLDLEFDLGLQDLPPPLPLYGADNADAAPDARKRRDSSMTLAGELHVPGAAGRAFGPDTSASFGGGAGGFEPAYGGYDDLGPMHDDGAGGADFGAAGFDFELGLDGEPPVAGGTRDKDGVESVLEGAAAGTNEHRAPPTPPLSDEADRLPPRNGQANGEEQQGKNQSTKPRSKRKQSVVKDKVTTLHSEEIARNREAYSEEMRKGNLKRDLERFAKGQREQVKEMLMLPGTKGAPELAAFMSTALRLDDLLLVPTSRNKRGAASKAATSIPDEDRSVTTHGPGPALKDRRVRESSVLSSQLGRGGQQQPLDDYEPYGGYDDMQGGANQDVDWNPFGPNAYAPAGDEDHVRAPSLAHSDQNAGRAHPRGSSVFADESNLGREPTSLSLGHGSQMPWNESYGGLDGAGGASSSFRNSFMDKPPMPGTPNRSHSASIGSTPSFLKHRMSSRAGSPAVGFGPGSDRNASLPGGMASNVSRAGTPGAFARDSSQVPGAPESQSSALFESNSQIENRLEKDSRAFYNYTKRFARGNKAEFLLSDVIPILSTAPNVAAMGFYNTLMLATKGLLKVHGQDEPYGEIRLAIA